MKISTCFRRAGAALAALAVAFFLPSCFEAHSNVKVNKDGSGTIENKTIMSAQMAGMMNAAAAKEGGAEVKNPLTDEKELKAKAAKMGEGVEFVSVTPIKFDDGRMGATAIYKFADVRKVKMAPGEGPGGGEDAGAEEEKETPITFDFTPGDKAKLTVKMPPPAKEEAKEGEPKAAEGAAAEGEAAMAMMAPMMQGMRISMTVEVAGNITDTTATNREGSKVTLMDIDFGKLMANPEFAKTLKSPDDMKDFAKFSKMAAKAGAKIEPKPEISVSFE